MSKIPCEIIRDLLPSYIDGLTSDVTNKEIEEHMKDCSACEEALQQMRAPEIELLEPERKEIDFLKKTKRKQRKMAIIGVVILLVCAASIYCGTYLFGGRYVNTEYLSYNLDVHDAKLAVTISTTSDQGIQRIDFDESEGMVEIRVRCVPKSIFYKNTKDASYETTSSDRISQVKIGDRIVWANGEEISPLTSNLYAAYNPYIGDMSADGKVVQALNMTAYTGNFKNELQTSQGPYAWKMIFENNFSSNREKAFEERLKQYAYLYLSQIGNLGEVVYEYQVDGETKQLTVTSSEATEFAGCDIKEVGKDMNLLESLVQKIGFSNVVISTTETDSSAPARNTESEKLTENVLQFTISNFAEDDVSGMRLDVECEGGQTHQSVIAGDDVVFQTGENIDFQLIAEDFPKNIPVGSRIILKLSLIDKDGNTHEVQNEVALDVDWGTKYMLGVSGNAKDGYHLGQVISPE